MRAYPPAKAVTSPADHVVLPFFHRLNQLRDIPARQESHEIHCGHTEERAHVVFVVQVISPGQISKHTILMYGDTFLGVPPAKTCESDSCNCRRRYVLRPKTLLPLFQVMNAWLRRGQIRKYLQEILQYTHYFEYIHIVEPVCACNLQQAPGKHAGSLGMVGHVSVHENHVRPSYDP